MPPNILLIIIDTARADIVYEMMANGELPALRSLSEKGMQFSNAVSSSPWTLPAHASILTGQRSSDHNTHAGNKQFNPDTSPLPEILKENGYYTYGISGNIWISAEFGFDRGFDNLSMKYDRFWTGKDLSGISEADSYWGKIQTFREIVDPKTFLPTVANGLYTKLFAGRSDKGAANTTRRTRKWFQQNADSTDPFFYFINYLEPHLKYKPKKKYTTSYLPDDVDYEDATRLKQDAWEYITGNIEYTRKDFEVFRSLYKGELRYIDHQISRLIAELENQDLRNETVIIVAGDHGENIGDHELMDHQYCLYQTLLHVPLLISGPGINSTNMSPLVETRDIFPTILTTAGINQPDTPSVSQNNLLKEPGRTVAISEYLAPQPSIESLKSQVSGPIKTDRALDRTYRAIQNGEWKLIENSEGGVELYDLSEDPFEKNDQSNTRSDLVTGLQEELEHREIPLSYQKGSAIEASTASRQRLKDLGYI